MEIAYPSTVGFHQHYNAGKVIPYVKGGTVKTCALSMVGEQYVDGQ
jgi:hypothetical protein